jgi:cohesin loading factor subunit SCC2
LLHRWYSLVREKRAPRQEFLKALVKVFDVDVGTKSTQDDIYFARYMAENFATFDYKTQEEVLTVTKSLTTVLSTTGMQVVESISPSHLLSQLRDDPRATATDHQVDDTVKLPMLRCSAVIGMVMLLKAHLKSLYGLSEE